MNDHIQRMFAQQQALERAIDPLRDIRKLLEPISAADMAYLELERQMDTRRKLLGNLDTLGLGPLAGINSAGYDATADIRASLGLGSLSESVADRVLRESIRGELSAGQLFRHGTLAGDLQSAGAIASAGEAAAMLRLQDGVASNAAERFAQGFGTAGDLAFRIAAHDEIALLAKQAIDVDRLTAYAFSGSAGAEALIARMEAMNSPWLKAAREIESVSAFAHLQAIGDLVHDVAPYANGVAAYLRADLGDWRDTLTMPPWTEMGADHLRTDLYVGSGFNQAVTDFTPLAFHRGARIARLPEVQQDELDEWCDEDADQLARNEAAYTRLLRFEIALRRSIVTVMTATFGDRWMERQLPANMLDRWTEKREKAINAGDEPGPLVDYADFTDYLPIIEKKDNWKQVYQHIFSRPEDIKESLQRLYPVRVATAHARIITLDDSLLLMVETKRVIRALAKAWRVATRLNA